MGEVFSKDYGNYNAVLYGWQQFGICFLSVKVGDSLGNRKGVANRFKLLSYTAILSELVESYSLAMPHAIYAITAKLYW